MSSEFQDLTILVPNDAKNDDFIEAFMACKNNSWGDCVWKSRYAAALDAITIMEHSIVKLVMNEQDLRDNILELELTNQQGEYYYYRAKAAYILTLASMWDGYPMYITKSSARNLCRG